MICFIIAYYNRKDKRRPISAIAELERSIRNMMYRPYRYMLLWFTENHPAPDRLVTNQWHFDLTFRRENWVTAVTTIMPNASAEASCRVEMAFSRNFSKSLSKAYAMV